MSYSLARVTLYALLSSIERDLRDLIRTAVSSSQSNTSIFSPDLATILKERAARDGGLSDEASLIDYLDFADSYKVILASKSRFSHDVFTAIRKTASRLEALVRIRNNVMHTRPLEFEDYPTVPSTCKILSDRYARHFPSLLLTVKSLSKDPFAPFNIDLTILAEKRARIPHNLPLPDFDETGFIGREKETSDILLLCGSPWPVVSIVGVGGVGKTALALRVAYALLEDSHADFDAIIWISSKTKMLTATEVSLIEHSIQDSLGIFERLSEDLSGKKRDDPVKEVLDYLNEFRIFLILDNLETIIDDRISKFISGLRGRSKILITSRIGLGEFEVRRHLEPLSNTDAVRLFQATARVRSVKVLLQLAKDKVEQLCKSMHNNPAFIKWYVTVVQSGKRPEDVLIDPKLFLDYCMENVFNYLTSLEKNICKAMTAVPGEHSQAMLAFICDMEIRELQKSLQKLLSTNLLKMNARTAGEEIDTVYELTDLARFYILNNVPMSEMEKRHFNSKRQSVAEIYDRYAWKDKYIYNPNFVVVKSRDEAVVARKLIEALAASRMRDYPRCFSIIEEAKNLYPTYHEVYRVEGWTRSMFGDYVGAAEAYETALRIHANSPLLRFFYGGYLLRCVNDTAGAIEQYRAALTLDSQSLDIELALARALLFAGEFDESEERINSVILTDRASTKVRRMGYDALCQIYLRRLDNALLESQYVEAVGISERLVMKSADMPVSMFDEKIFNTLMRASKSLWHLRRQLFASSLFPDVERLVARMEEICQWGRHAIARGTAEHAAGSLDAQAGEINQVQIGKIVSFESVGVSGWIRINDSEERVFFDKNEFVDRHNVSLTSFWRAGVDLKFGVVEKAGRNCAFDIEVHRGVSTDDLCTDGGILEGIFYWKGHAPTFGFCAVPQVGNVFIHSSDFVSQEEWRAVKKYEPVQFRLFRTGTGFKGVEARRAAAVLASGVEGEAEGHGF